MAQHVCITGCTKGLGHALAQWFSNEKWIVSGLGRNAESIKALQREATGENGFFGVTDVTDDSAVSAFAADLTARLGVPDLLVNNAGIVKAGNPENQTTEEYRQTMAVHADGVFFGCRAAIPEMANSGGGSIINMCSLAAIQGESYVAAYCMAKGGIDAYTRAVAVHCAQNNNGVRCNSIHPSGIETPMVAEFGSQMTTKYGAQVLEDMAAHASKSGEPEDIANACVFLASDLSAYVTGQTLNVDGGMLT